MRISLLLTLAACGCAAIASGGVITNAYIGTGLHLDGSPAIEGIYQQGISEAHAASQRVPGTVADVVVSGTPLEVGSTIYLNAVILGMQSNSGAEVTIKDQVTVTGHTGSGYMSYVFNVDSMHSESGVGWATVSLELTQGSNGQGLDICSITRNMTDPNALVSKTCTGDLPIEHIPFTFGAPLDFTLLARVTTLAIFPGAPGTAASTSTIRLDRVVVTDQNGNVIPDAQVQFASAMNTPEPGTYGVAGVSLLLIGVCESIRRKRA